MIMEELAKKIEEEILNHVREPQIPDREVNLLDFGARGDGRTDCSESFKRAIEELSKQGGGRLIVPEGVFLTGPIHLKSNIELHVKGTIKFIPDPERYLPVVLTRFEGIELYNYSPLVYALDCENVAITGSGVLDGSADNEHWWPWKGKKDFGWKEGLPNQQEDVKKLKEMAERGTPVEERVFGKGHYLRPSFVQFYRCRNVLVEGVKIINSPMWCVHPVLSENVIIRNIEISSTGPNNDGIDPESCKYMLIEKCRFDTGDDSVVIKSGRDADGRRIGVPSEYILVRDNLVISQASHGGLVIGSEMSGGVRNVVARNNVYMNVERALRLKTNSRRGGYMENIFFIDNVAVNVSEEVIRINLRYDNEEGEYLPVVRSVFVKNLKATGGKYAVRIEGLENDYVKDILISDTIIEGAKISVLLEFGQLGMENVIMNGSRFEKLYIEGKALLK
ncbi:exopolygalacturonase PelB [Thermotoga maritima]|uniref:Exo-poly-alpha-D-galacturonosidase, putative n=1 Tax=Thermotoga maritima (strain ATCC 43589 / DSM 3109 / JCM 10099 / NBRC 100826 / MSB8) TaxID=243274 RepID=Q9WYR8_THEMA|nr:exopolygalacturonase PelB [Thermotoga maritima]AAD35522.1 exo-poly-alpha-D-galacturonosidase, putative [Thermotoga maritima MSB8]